MAKRRFSTLSGNSAVSGAGIFNYGMLTVSNSTLSGDSAGSGGGGIENMGTLTVSNSTLSADTANFGGGGGIENIETLTVNNSTLSGNTAYFGGGGIENRATLTVSNSNLSSNSARGAGGIENLGTLTVSNTTLCGNTASGGTTAGGIANIASFFQNATVLLLESTIANNSVSSSDRTSSQLFSGHTGTGTGQAIVQFSNTILTGDGQRPNLFADTGGTFHSQGYNLSSDDGSGFLSGGGDITNTDPMLGLLQDNGGPTQTMALMPGSPALNAGDPSQLGTPDQRGVVRSGGVNIGGYQASATTFLVSAPDMVQSGVQFDVTVTAVDPFGQLAVGYTGTVTFTTSDPDPDVVLPADYTFTLNDGGVHTFTDTGLGETTLITPGDQMLTVMDTADNTITGSIIITVSAGPGPAPHGQRPPPSTLQPGPAQAEAWTRSVPSASEVVAADQWFASFQPSDQGSATFMVTLNTQVPVHLTVTDTADNTVVAALDLIVL
jgi:hypothetical protein